MTEILTPVGRLVQGSVHDLEPVTDPITKQPKFDKTGKPRNQCFFSIAVPKTQADWKQEPWGQTITQVALGAFPNGQTMQATFAWKVVDGDSTIPDKANKRPCDRQGFPGNWVLKFSGGYLPQLVTANGTAPLPAGQKIELGDYIQVAGKVAGNGSHQSPGVYLNPNAVAFTGYGERIAYERDFSQVGFGQDPVPAGVMATPPAGMTVAPALPQPTPATAAAAYSAPVAFGGAPVPPNPAILQAPLAAPVAPAAPVAKQMTAKATGPYEAYIAQGWTDALLVQHGLMVG
jgi:hypothetical protein